MVKKNILVIFGGVSGEHEVSLVSANTIFENIDKELFNPIPVLITQRGKWYTNTDWKRAIDGVSGGSIPVTLSPDPTMPYLIPLNDKNLPDELDVKIDCVFSILHGTNGEDGTLQGLLTLAELPFVGAGVGGSFLGMDKEYMKIVFEKYELPIVKHKTFKYSNWLEDKVEIIEEIKSGLESPLFVKPCNLGSSVGISKVVDFSELSNALDIAFEYDNKVIVEEGVGNSRELEVAVIGNEDLEVSTVGEVLPAGDFYDYHSKYVDEDSETVIPADIEDGLREKIRSIAEKAFVSLEVYGLARVDFLYDQKNEKIYLNELNTLPGFTPISMYPELLVDKGYTITGIITRLIELAFERFQIQARIKRRYTG